MLHLVQTGHSCGISDCGTVTHRVHLEKRSEAVDGERAVMSVNLIFKIAAVGILVSVLSQILKQSGREEHAFLTGIAGLVLVLFWLVPYISQLFETIKSLFAL